MKRHVLRTIKTGGCGVVLMTLLFAAQGPAIADVSATQSTAATCASADVAAGTYRVVARNSGLTLDVDHSGLENGTRVVQFENRDKPNQQWTVGPSGNGFSKLTAKHSGLALEVSAGGMDNGAAVQQWNYRNTDNQQWCITATSDGYYKLLAKHSGLALDVSQRSTKNRAAVHQWGYAGAENQQWRLEPVSGSGLPPEQAPPEDTPPPADGECTLATPAPGIPADFGLFTVLSKNTERKNFCTLSKWYSESPGKQVFRLFEGDDFADNNPGGRSHARTEVNSPSFRADGTWHTFEARMQPSRAASETYTIAQIFAGCCGPQLRIEVKSNGRINMGSRSNDNVRISGDKNYADGKTSFKIKLRTNGDRFEVFFDGVKKYSGRTEEAATGNRDATYHFRWGLYYSNPETETSNTVTEITRN